MREPPGDEVEAVAKGPAGRTWVAAVVGLMLTRCDPFPRPDQALEPLADTKTQRSELPEVLFSGCELVRRGRVCELRSGKELVLWVAASADQTHALTLSGQPVAATASRALEGGLQYRLTVSDVPSTLVLSSRQGWQWSLQLSPFVPFPDLEQADALRRSGQTEAALALIQRSESVAREEERSRAAALRGRIQLAQGETRRAASALMQTLKDAVRLGRMSNATLDAFALAFIQIVHLNDFAAAREALQVGQSLAADDPAAIGWHHHFSGLLDLQMGDLAAARRRFQEAAAYSARLDDTRQRQDSTIYLAQVAFELGELSRAVRLLEDLVATDEHLTTCDLGQLHTNLAWFGMQAEGRLSSVDIQRHLELAEKYDTDCGNPLFLRVDAINMGLWALERGDLEGARRQLRELATIEGGQTSEYLAWQLELEARVALESGQPASALAAFEREALISESRGDGDGQLRALVGSGEAYERLGQLARSLRAFRSADELLTNRREAFFAGIERDGFLGRREAATRALAGSLVRHGQVRKALGVALRAFERALGGFTLAERSRRLPPSARAEWDAHFSAYQRARAELEELSLDDWRRSVPEINQRRTQRREQAALAERHLTRAWQLLGPDAPKVGAGFALAPGQLGLVLFPAQKDWLVFTLWEAEVEVRRFPSLASLTGDPRSERTAPVLQQAARHASADELAIVAYGAAQGIDFVTLPIDGEPLVERMPIRHRVGSSRQVAASARAHPIAIVADPEEDLLSARREAARVAELSHAGTEQVLIGDQARRDVVLELLRSSRLFHYAGHGSPASTTHLNGLPLSGGGLLLPSDVLASSQVPEVVVLAACETGAGEQLAWAGGWSLAHAFVAAGTREVVAPVRKVDDGDASKLMVWLHEVLARDPTVTAARSLQMAQRAARKDTLSSWEAFRVLSP